MVLLGLVGSIDKATYMLYELAHENCLMFVSWLLTEN